MVLPVLFDWLGTFLGLDIIPIKQTIDKPMRFHEKYKTLLTREGINTPLRLAHFIAQLDHESGLKPISENLNYSTDSLIRMFGRHRISIEDAERYGRNTYHKANQEMIANSIYGGKWGFDNLGNKDIGDGWKFRGRGFIQLTGRANYKAMGYEVNPDALLNEADALIAALWYWNNKGINRYADVDNIRGVTAAINGGYNGLEDRNRLLVKYKKEFNI